MTQSPRPGHVLLWPKAHLNHLAGVVQSPHASKGQDVPRAPRSPCRGHWARSHSLLQGRQGLEPNSVHHAVSAWRWGWDKEPYSGAGFPAHGLGGILTHALAGAGTKTPLAALGDDRGARVHETVSPGHDFSVAIRSVKKTRDTSHSARRRDAPSSSVLQGRDVREEEPLSAPSWHKRVQEKQEPQRPETERCELRAPTAQTGMRGRTEPGVLSSWCRIDPRGPPRPSAPDLEACSSPEALRAWTPFWHLPGRPNSAPGFWLPRPSAVAPRPPSAWGPPTAQLPDPRVGTTALKAGWAPSPCRAPWRCLLLTPGASGLHQGHAATWAGVRGGGATTPGLAGQGPPGWQARRRAERCPRQSEHRQGRRVQRREADASVAQKATAATRHP